MTVATPQISVIDLHVGSAVYSSKMEKIGRLRFMVVDPDSESVSHLVLEKGMLLAHDVLAPVTSVNQVLHRGIFLSITSEEILALPEFLEHRYLTRGRDNDRDDEQPGPRQHRDRNDRGPGGGGGHGGHRRPHKRFRRN